MGRGYVTMHKLEEDEVHVWYSFETPVHEEGVVNFAKGSYKKRDGVFMSRGYCKYNKKTGEFTVDENRTDPYLIEEKNWIGAVHYTLVRHRKEEKGYPNVTGWTGG